VVRTLSQAAKWVDTVGLALLFPKTDVVLPSLWEQVNGDAGRNWAVRDAEGGFVEWTAESRLRHAVLVGERPDKEVKSVKRELLR